MSRRSGPRFWRTAFRLLYAILARLDPLIRAGWRRFGIGNVVELEVARRKPRAGTRRRLVGLLHAGGRTYVGHPNGDVGWTRDLESADRGAAIVRYHDGTEWRVAATRLLPGDERENAIRATDEHPFPGNVVYRLARGHVRRVGTFFRLRDRA